MQGGTDFLASALFVQVSTFSLAGWEASDEVGGNS